MYVCAPCACLLLIEGTKSSETRAADGCKLLCGCWEPYSGPLLDQQVLFLTDEPDLQPAYFVTYNTRLNQSNRETEPSSADSHLSAQH